MDRRRDHLTEQQQKLQSPRQANLQYVDDTWERLLNALERLEQSTEEFRHVAASRLDNHPDKGRITEDELGIRVEVHLQIQCLQKVVNPVREDVAWLIEDFLAWFGGREARPPAPVDEYAVPVLKCILGYRYDLPSLPPPPNLNRSDVLTAAEYLGIGMHASAKIEEGFKCGPEKTATRHFHQRGSVTQGLTRLAKLPDRWGASLADQLSRELRTSQIGESWTTKLGKLLRGAGGSTEAPQKAPAPYPANEEFRVRWTSPESRLHNCFVSRSETGELHLVSANTEYTCPACGGVTRMSEVTRKAVNSEMHSRVRRQFDRVSERIPESREPVDFECATCGRPVRLLGESVELEHTKLYAPVGLLELEDASKSRD